MFKRIICKLKGIEYFYADLEIEQLSLYQKYFNSILSSVDVNNFTQRSLSRSFNKILIDEDYKKIDKILDEAEKDNMKSGYLQVMFEQYVFADIMLREKHRYQWVKTVMKRKSTDFFPDPNAITHSLFQTNK